MINETLDFVLTVCISIVIIGGAYLITWMCIQSFIDNYKNCCKKKYKWKCSDCGEVLKSTTQPFCKRCSHINRASTKMDRIK